MIWESWSAFWAMGGAGPYVWGSYGVTLIAVALELFMVFRRRKLTVIRLQRLARGRASNDRRSTFAESENS